ncbi:hypothetical protein H310_07749 [Aphanomyces invadans]|uniref:Uncharacterized protein n=1 Tax=Aphanomyces invadans TaxID=157072 RepID=A0A024U0C9_9STRA|nr:hypothetical protein H310_07749 [Aphanomyces invadans]ETV99684.1 hypothetical protein H310_07749 [Aphanomyces invadans]|eukprot:XP_008871460.1 hypothetical protein H310_07749 [Aphanomyces invadans]
MRRLVHGEHLRRMGRNYMPTCFLFNRKLCFLVDAGCVHLHLCLQTRGGLRFIKYNLVQVGPALAGEFNVFVRVVVFFLAFLFVTHLVIRAVARGRRVVSESVADHDEAGHNEARRDDGGDSGGNHKRVAAFQSMVVLCDRRRVLDVLDFLLGIVGILHWVLANFCAVDNANPVGHDRVLDVATHRQLELVDLAFVKMQNVLAANLIVVVAVALDVCHDRVHLAAALGRVAHKLFERDQVDVKCIAGRVCVRGKRSSRGLHQRVRTGIVNTNPLRFFAFIGGTHGFRGCSCGSSVDRCRDG